MKRKFVGLAALIFMLVLLSQAHAQQSTGSISPAMSQHLIVSANGLYTTIQAALEKAHEGDEIEVHGGVYVGPLVVQKSGKLIGVDHPVIDGHEQGTVVTLSAPNIVFRGFEVRGSGHEPDQDHSGVTLTAPRIAVENNHLYDVLFGIFVSKAEASIVRNNEITSKREYDVGRKGDSIRLWYSPRVLVEKNYVHEARDLVVWYSSDVVIRENTVERGRYGVHLMYCDRAKIERNRLLNNSVGIFAMYSNGVIIQENWIRGQRGPSGYALGFKDADEVSVRSNVLVDNHVGVYLDNTPFSPQGYGHFRENIFAFNDEGVALLPAVRGNAFESNTFWENIEQVAVQAGAMVDANRWQGNYWSDYDGLDANGDEVGDLPYHSERLFENLTDREPRLMALLHSPAAQAIEFAARSFPIVRPQPKLIDSAPRVQPASLPPFVTVSEGDSSGKMREMALALLGLGALCGMLAFARSREQKKKSSDPSSAARVVPHISLSVNRVSKSYGKAKVLDTISFEAHSGEALALWGPNGAGKTTLLKAILGLIDFRGEICVEGRDARRDGKRARRSVGYVPQEVVFYDWSVRATMEFYARFKKADTERISELLGNLGLNEHAHKPVLALSGGLKQRLALAIALLADPPVLLLDEPTANLDKHARSDYLTLLAGVRHQGKTIIFASHRFEEIEALADRVLLLDRGTLKESLTPQALRARFAPEVELTLWMPESRRVDALEYLAQEGLNAHLNGRGTVVVRVRTEQKMKPLRVLSEREIPVLNFEIEQVQPWN